MVWFAPQRVGHVAEVAQDGALALVEHFRLGRDKAGIVGHDVLEPLAGAAQQLVVVQFHVLAQATRLKRTTAVAAGRRAVPASSRNVG